MCQVDELVALAAQVVGHHRRLALHAGDDGDPHAPALHRLDQRAEIAVAREQHHVVEMGREFERVDRELDIHVALDLAPARAVGEFLGGLGDDAVAVIVEPIDERPDRRVFLVLDNRRVVEGAQEIAAGLKLLQQPPEIDVEAERPGRRVQIGAVDEEGCAGLAWHRPHPSLSGRMGRPLANDGPPDRMAGLTRSPARPC